MYGFTEATYERVTGVAGWYRRFRDGIDRLLARGLPLKLKTMAMTLTVDELDDMRAFADELGVSFRFDPLLTACLDGDMAPTSLRLSPEEAVALDEADPERMESWAEFCERYLGPSQGPRKTVYLWGRATDVPH